METNLISRREHEMDRADRALDAAWPDRKGREYVESMQSAAKELEAIAVEMQKNRIVSIEQSRTFRYLGSIYSDLVPAMGKKMLIKAQKAYSTAESLLEGYDDKLEGAKLNFNFGNTLRQIDPNSLALLQEAEGRILSARAVFVELAPQYLNQIDKALMSIRALLKIVPVLALIESNFREIDHLSIELEEDGDPKKVASKILEIMKREGGIAGWVGRVKALASELPAELMEGETYAEIQAKINSIARFVVGGNSMDSHDKQILDMLRKRLDADLNCGKVSPDRAKTLSGVMAQLGSILSGKDDDLQNIINTGDDLRGLIRSQFETSHYLSHDIPRPPDGSRAAELVELCWSLRRYLLEDMNRPGRGPIESKAALDLTMRAANVDKRIYEAGDNSEKAIIVDNEELRPLSHAIREFSGRMYPMLAKPVWSTVKASVDTTAVFYSGSDDLRPKLTALCNSIGLSLMSQPKGESVANARWKQLQKSMTTIFDFRGENGPALAAVAYELGIALTLGKPIVVITSEQQRPPFDVDVEPVVLYGNKDDDVSLAAAIDQSIVWTYPRIHSKECLPSIFYILRKYPRPQPDTYLDQTIGLLENQVEDPDPSAVNQTVSKFIHFLDDTKMTLIHPAWPPVYSQTDRHRVFHVMPFRPDWADDVAKATRITCEEIGADYIRGDDVEDPNVIRSIWEEIAKSTHTVVDLTDFNANVALELGIVHTLGRSCLIVGQGDTVDRLFPMIAKHRVQSYFTEIELSELVRKFLKWD